jgi:hypothetical protein
MGKVCIIYLLLIVLLLVIWLHSMEQLLVSFPLIRKPSLTYKWLEDPNLNYPKFEYIYPNKVCSKITNMTSIPYSQASSNSISPRSNPALQDPNVRMTTSPSDNWNQIGRIVWLPKLVSKDLGWKLHKLMLLLYLDIKVRKLSWDMDRLSLLQLPHAQIHPTQEWWLLQGCSARMQLNVECGLHHMWRHRYHRDHKL